MLGLKLTHVNKRSPQFQEGANALAGESAAVFASPHDRETHTVFWSIFKQRCVERGFENTITDVSVKSKFVLTLDMCIRNHHVVLIIWQLYRQCFSNVVFWNIYFFNSNLSDSGAQMSNWQFATNCSGNNLALNRRQGITLTNYNPIHWRIYASSDFNDFTHLSRNQKIPGMTFNNGLALSWR